MDVKSTFLNGFLEEEVYICYEVNKHKDKVLQLKKYLVLIEASPKGFI
jgi:hypothetical protein